jgi:hypothetical protein
MKYSTKLMKGKKIIMSFNPIKIIIWIIQTLFEWGKDDKNHYSSQVYLTNFQ